jgi:hypothetical protein
MNGKFCSRSFELQLLSCCTRMEFTRFHRVVNFFFKDGHTCVWCCCTCRYTLVTYRRTRACWPSLHHIRIPMPAGRPHQRARCLYVRVHARSYVRACIMPTVDTPTCCVVRTGHTGNISEMCMHTWCPAKCDEPPAGMPIRMRWVCTHHVVYVARAALRTYLDSIVIHACMISWTGLSICLAVVWICVTLRHGKTGRALATEIRICMHATGRP